MESRVVKSISCEDPKIKMLWEQCERTIAEAERTKNFLFQISFWNKVLSSLLLVYVMETFRVLPISSFFNC